MSGTPLAVPADHPAYAGHFPGRPILPAVVMLAEALAAITARTGKPASAWTLQQAKFVRTVEPGQSMLLACDAADDGGQRFEIRVAGEMVASGRFTSATT